MNAPRRPLTRMAACGLAGHAFYELAAGVGMPLASVVGPVPAAIGWGAATVAVLRATGGRIPPADLVSGAVNGFGLAAVLGHFTAWPVRVSRLGLPWLVECEGLSGRAMPAYNALLYISAAAAVGGLLVECDGARVVGLLMAGFVAPALVRGQRWEYRRLREQAALAPRWWNRRLVPTPV